MSGETLKDLKRGLQKVLRRPSRETQAASAEYKARKDVVGDQPEVG
jgi:hypothetical protein